MSHSVASIHALLTAKSYSAARRALRELLRERPDDPYLMQLRVRIETEAGENKQALEFARQALSDSPDNIELRAQEIEILLSMRRRSEVRRLAKQFQEDFPHAHGQIERIKLAATVARQDLRGAQNTLDEYLEDADDYLEFAPYEAKDLGTGYNAIGSVYKANDLLLKAYEQIPDDVELNAVLAENSYQLVRPFQARKYASYVLSERPEDMRMRIVYWTSLLMLFPPTFFFFHAFKLVRVLGSMVGQWVSVIALLALDYVFEFSVVWRIWVSAVRVTLQLPDSLSFLVSIAFLWAPLVFYIIVLDERVYDFLFRDRKVKMRKGF